MLIQKRVREIISMLLALFLVFGNFPAGAPFSQAEQDLQSEQSGSNDPMVVGTGEANPTPSALPSENENADELGGEPTATPTEMPTEVLTEEPTEEPTAEPVETPTAEPTETPTEEPTLEPTAEPTEEPTAEPTQEPVKTVYTDEDFYNVAISWVFEALEDQVMPELEPLHVEVKLEYLDNNNNWQPVASSEMPEEYSVFLSVPLGGSQYTKIPLKDLAVEGEYRARLAASQEVDASYDDSDLSTRITVKMPQPMVAMGVAGFVDIMPLSIIEQPVNLEVYVTVNITEAKHTDKIETTLYSNAEKDFTVHSSYDNEIVYTVKLIPDAEDVISYEISVPLVTEHYSLHLYRTKGIVGDGVKIELRALRYAEHTLVKKWNDNNRANRPDSTNFQLQVQADGTSTWTDATVAGSSYTITNPQGNTQTHVFEKLPSFDSNLKALHYKVVEKDVSADYIATYATGDNGETVITNTLKTTLTFDKEWKDLGAPGARPNSSDWGDGLTLWRTSPGGEPEQVTIPFSVAVDKPKPDSWQATLGNIPMYDENGQPYTYFVKEDDSGWKRAPMDLGDYATKTENAGEHREKTDGIYDGGTSTSTIEDTIQFEFTKDWKDGAGENRPDLEFELYRILEDPATSAVPSVSTASPVSDMDKMAITSAGYDFSKPITYKVGSNVDLPRYGPEGHAYLYFLVEKLKGDTTDYVQELQDGDPYLFDGKTITNRKQKTVYPTATKKMNARALQNVSKDVTFGLERRVLGGDFEPVENASLTIEDFVAEKMEQTGVFTAGYPGYDTNGFPYEYRAVEKSMTIGGKTGEIQPDGTLEVGDYTFKMSVDSDGTIVNTLVGETAIGVKKTWEPEWTNELIQPSITLLFLRDGIEYTPDPLPQIEGLNISANEDGTVTITRTDSDAEANFDVIFSGLPKYDEGGRPYEYSLDENSCSGDYGFTDLTYAEGTNPDYTPYNVANITNTQGAGACLVFNIAKIWLDDGDSGHRETVTVSLFYNEKAGTAEPPSYVAVGEPFTISESDVWVKRYTYEPVESQETAPEKWKYSNYIMRETAVGEHNVTYADIGDANGTVEATYHNYAVSHYQDSSSESRFKIENLRVGTLKVVIDKEWAIGDVTGLEAEFTLYKDGVAVAPVIILPWGQNSATFDSLAKYDNKGAVISYSADETAIIQPDSNPAFSIRTGFVGNTANVLGVGKIVKSFNLKGYEVGPVRHTDDTMTYNAKNVRSESGVLSVNKVWRDEEASVAIRPDIALILTRTSPLNDAVPNEPVNNAQRNWDTSLHHWYWTCDFGTLPRYDEKGFEYVYEVTEEIKQTGLYYTQSYYREGTEDDETTHPLAKGDAKSSEEIFIPMGEAGEGKFARATFDENTRGTIINTVQKDLEIPVFKLWAAVPAWFKTADLPDAIINLYRMTSLEDKKEYDEPHCAATMTLENGKPGDTFTTFEKNNTPLYMYTDYGVRYTYYIKEDPINGYGSSHDDANFIVTNTYNGEDEPKVAITVTKNWNWALMDAAQTKYPSVTFEVWQMLDGDYCGSTPCATFEMLGGDIPESKMKTESHTFNDLPYYAPDGVRIFTYEVKENPALLGYTTTPSLKQSVVLDSGSDLHTGGVDFTNTYDPRDQTEIVAYKVWDDNSNAFGVRPNISAAENTLNYQLWRKLPGDADGQDMTLQVKNVEWVQDGEEAYQWICTFTPASLDAFPTYSTTGKKYIYYVTEALNAQYKDIYELVPHSTPSLSLTNKVKTVHATFTKEWVDSKTNMALPRGRLEPMLGFGLPTAIRFELFESTDDGKNWNPVQGANPEECAIDKLLNGAKLTFTSDPLPKYTSSLEKIQYMVKETAMEMDDAWTDVEDDKVDFITVNDVHDSEYHTTVTNSFAVLKLYFVKNWEDESNRDGKRPTSLDIRVTQEVSDAETTVTLSKASTSGDESQAEGHPATDTGNRWRGELWLPKIEAGTPNTEAVYAAEEILTETATADGYTQTAEDQDSQTNYTWFSFTNSRAVQLIAITATKSWAGEVNNTIRPDSVTLQLQAKGVGEAESKWMNVQEPQTIVGAIPYENPWADTAEWIGLPAYMPKEKPTDPAVHFEYRVVEINAPLGYKLTSSPSLLTTTDETTAETIALTNTMETITIKGTKTWDDQSDAYELRPDDLVLVVESGNGDYSSFPVDWKNTEDDVWSYTIENLPKYEKLNAGEVVLAVYTVTETLPAPQYKNDTPSTMGSVDANGNVTNANFTNTLKTISIKGTKEWDDSDDKYGIRPKAASAWLTLLVYAENTPVPSDKYTISWQQGALSNQWEYTIEDLPMYDSAGGLVTYTVKEIVPPGYDAVMDAVIVTADETGTVQAEPLKNAVTLITIEGKKTWVNDAHEPELRPENIKLKVWDQNGDEATNGTIAWTQPTGAVWRYIITGLPRYIPSKTLGNPPEEAEYTVEEEDDHRYRHSPQTRKTGGSVDQFNGNVTGADFTNTLAVGDLTGTKIWDDNNDTFGLRPDILDAIELKLYYVYPGIEKPVPKDHYSIVWEQDAGNPNRWNYTLKNLPRYDADDQLVTYRIEEICPYGYEMTSSAPSNIAMAESGVQEIEPFINSLKTISVEGSKIWDDGSDANGVRPDTIDLVVYVDGTEMKPQPTITWADTDTDAWTFSADGLPMYWPGGTKPAVYAVEENFDDIQYIVGYANGYITAPMTGNISSLDVKNTLRCMLAIENLTVNQARPGHTNAGGFVAVNTISLAEREYGDYVNKGLYVFWKAEEYWEPSRALSITYLPRTGGETKTIHFTMDDLSPLYDVFPEAKLIEIQGGYELVLSTDFLTMPVRADVQVRFLPTVAVLNTTGRKAGLAFAAYMAASSAGTSTAPATGGEVSVEGGHWDTREDGVGDRYVEQTVYGKAANGYVVDYKNLSLAIPNGVQAPGQGVLLNPQANGSFAVSLTTPLGGETATVTVHGQVEILQQNAKGEPTSVSICIDDMPCPMDVGISFVTAKTDTEPGHGKTPQTGDERDFTCDYALLFAGAALMALGAFLLLKKRKQA